MTLHCGSCRHEWTLQPDLPKELGAFAAWCRAQTCPNCGADSSKVLCGAQPVEASAS